MPMRSRPRGRGPRKYADACSLAADVLADGRLPEAEPGRGPGEAAGLLDGEKGRQELGIVTRHKVSQ
jgi:hypothetical protein